MGEQNPCPAPTLEDELTNLLGTRELAKKAIAMMAERSPFRVTYDPEVGAGYIYVAGEIPDGGVKRTIWSYDENIYVDLDHQNRLVGIEILSKRLIHPLTLAAAEKPGE